MTVGQARRLLHATGSTSKRLAVLSGTGTVVAWDLIAIPGRESARLRRILLRLLDRQA